MSRDRKFKVPHMYVIIFLIIVFAAILTYILPAGSYQRVKDAATGRTLVSAGTYAQIASSPTSLFALFQAPIRGLISSADVIFMVLMYGGAFGIINATMVLEMGVESASMKMKNTAFLLIPIMMILFSIMGGFLGLTNSALVFVPLCVSFSRALGYDAMVGVAMVNIGIISGFSAGAMNMYTTGVAQGIAELPLFSAFGVRLAIHGVLLVTGILFVLRYAYSVKKDFRKSIVFDLEQRFRLEEKESDVEKRDFTGRKKLVLTVLIVGFAGLVAGILKGWSSGTQISAYLLGLSLVVGCVDGKNADEITGGFIKGMKDVLTGALVIGFAKGILVILSDGKIIDTFLYGASVLLEHKSLFAGVLLMFAFQWCFNFLVTSGSGQAAITMPLMVPLGDLVGVTRQTSVIAFQLGDGLSNLLYPTSGSTMANLSIAEITFDQWLKFIWPYMAISFIESCLILMCCVQFNVGPF